MTLALPGSTSGGINGKRSCGMAANGGAALTVDQTVEMMTLTFHDCFLVSGLVFALALIPVTYLARHAKT